MATSPEISDRIIEAVMAQKLAPGARLGEQYDERDSLPAMFPDRVTRDADGHEVSFEVPKTLIFAKTDSHAEDIIDIVREEFAEENKFCKKITYRSEEDPKSVLSQFRNDYYPRIAVTVDMIATGTDVKPLEVLLFMRDGRISAQSGHRRFPIAAALPIRGFPTGVLGSGRWRPHPIGQELTVATGSFL